MSAVVGSLETLHGDQIMMDVDHHADMDHILLPEDLPSSSHVGIKRKAPDSDNLPSLIGDGQMMYEDGDREWAAENPNQMQMEAAFGASERIPMTEIKYAPEEALLDADPGLLKKGSEEQEIFPAEQTDNVVDAVIMDDEPTSSSSYMVAQEELNGPQPAPAILKQQIQEQDQEQPESSIQHPLAASDLGVSPGETNDPVVRALNRLISPSSGGGISDVKHLPTLEALLEAERRHPMRVVLLLPLQFSSQAVKVAALQGRSRVIRCIEGWVNEAFTEANSPPPGRPPNPAMLQVLKAAIACMASLPMDVETMRRTGAGRVAGSLRKYNYDGKGPDSVQGRAVELVDQWKRLARDPILSATEEASASASNASKKAKVVGDKLKVDVSRAGGTAGAYPSPASAASPSNVGGGVQMKDGDEQLLKDLAAKPGTTGGGIRNSVPTVRKVHTLQRIGIEEVQGIDSGAMGGKHLVTSPRGSVDLDALPSPSSDKLPYADGPKQLAAPRPRLGTLLGSGGFGAAAAGRLGSLRDVPATRLAAAPPPPVLYPAGNASAQISASIARTTTLFAPSSPSPPPLFVGSIGGGGADRDAVAGMSAANAKAAAAASRIPSPVPEPRRAKRKAVSWAEDEELVKMRWFKKDEPPVTAQADSLYTDEELERQAHPPGSRLSIMGGTQDPYIVQKHSRRGGAVAAGGGAVPGFESVAKREHAFERNAIQELHKQEAAEKKQMLERLAMMSEQIPWPFCQPSDIVSGPVVPCVAFDPEWNWAAGEESEDKHHAAERAYHLPPVLYPTPNHVPPSPGEPLTPDLDPDYHRSRPIPTIPMVAAVTTAPVATLEASMIPGALPPPPGQILVAPSGFPTQGPGSFPPPPFPAHSAAVGPSAATGPAPPPPAAILVTSGPGGSSSVPVDLGSLLASLAPALASVTGGGPSSSASAQQPPQQQQFGIGIASGGGSDVQQLLSGFSSFLGGMQQQHPLHLGPSLAAPLAGGNGSFTAQGQIASGFHVDPLGAGGPTMGGAGGGQQQRHRDWGGQGGFQGGASDGPPIMTRQPSFPPHHDTGVGGPPPPPRRGDVGLPLPPQHAWDRGRNDLGGPAGMGFPGGGPGMLPAGQPPPPPPRGTRAGPGMETEGRMGGGVGGPDSMWGTGPTGGPGLRLGLNDAPFREDHRHSGPQFDGPQGGGGGDRRGHEGGGGGGRGPNQGPMGVPLNQICAFFSLPVGCKKAESCRFKHIKVGPDEVQTILRNMPPGPRGGGGGRGRGF